MPDTIPVTVDLDRGEIALGSRNVRLERVDGTFRFRIPGGAIVRAVTFAERCGAVASAATAVDRPAALTAALRGVALEGTAGDAAEAIVLALAGGAEPVIAFPECASRAALARGWDPESVSAAPAIEVDRALTPAAATPQVSGGWMRFVFAGEEPDELPRLCADMAERLVERGVMQPATPSEFDVLPNDEARAPTSRVPQGSGPLTPQLPSGRPTGVKGTDDVASGRAGVARPRQTVLRTRTGSNTAPASAGASVDAAVRAGHELGAVSSLPQRRAVAPRTRAALTSYTSASQTSNLAAIPEPRIRRVLRPPADGAAPSSPSSESAPHIAGPSRPVERAGKPMAADWPLHLPFADLAAATLSLPQPETKETQTTLPNRATAVKTEDWLAEIAQALSAECDLRGMDS